MAQAALTICRQCGNVSRGDCCKPNETDRTNQDQRRLYRTARWRRVRSRVLSRDKGLCQKCLITGKITPGNQIDHIKRATDHPELFWNAANLQTLCRSCHSKKTSREGGIESSRR